jgi:hypothetical protein
MEFDSSSQNQYRCTDRHNFAQPSAMAGHTLCQMTVLLLWGLLCGWVNYNDLTSFFPFSVLVSVGKAFRKNGRVDPHDAFSAYDVAFGG